tara:strand:+ start:244 stop:513 length:270 start_codon:yes stop_codon:yes gene_type:complete
MVTCIKCITVIEKYQYYLPLFKYRGSDIIYYVMALTYLKEILWLENFGIRLLNLRNGEQLTTCCRVYLIDSSQILVLPELKLNTEFINK